MQKTVKFLILLCGVAWGTQALAADVSEQIKAAVAKGDFKTVQMLVISNPEMANQAESALLKFTLAHIDDNPTLASQAMATASSLESKMTKIGAGAIVDDLRLIVREIADKKVLVCNPEAKSGEEEKKVSAGSQQEAETEALAAIMNAAQAFAEGSVVHSIDAELASQIQAQNAKCGQGDSAQLAQLPQFNPIHPPGPRPASEE